MTISLPTLSTVAGVVLALVIVLGVAVVRLRRRARIDDHAMATLMRYVGQLRERVEVLQGKKVR